MTLDELESLGRRLEMIYESLLHEGRTTSATCVHEAQSALRVLWANKLDRLDATQMADVALNAARYCWLRSHPVFQVKELPNELELLDACIDRYMVGLETEE